MKSSRRGPFSSLSLTACVLALVLTGCSPRPPLPAPAGPTAFKAWLPALWERSEYWQRYQAKVRIKAQSAEKRFTLETAILANLPDQFRLEAFRMGQTVGVLILNHGQCSLFIPSEKMLLTAPRSEDLTNYLLGIALPIDGFGACLSAAVSARERNGFEVVPQQQEWLGFARPSPGEWTSVWHFSAEPQAITSLKIQREAWDFVIRYEPPVGLAVEEIPQNITFTSAKWEIEAIVQELKPVGELQEDAFSSDFGGEVRRVRVKGTASE